MPEQNSWLATHEDKTKQLLRELEICIYQGSSDGKLNLRSVYKMVNGSLNEIRRLHKEVNQLKKDIKNMLVDFDSDIKITS